MVTSVAAANAVSDTAGQPRVAAGQPPVAPKQATTSFPGPNPNLLLDPVLGLVVIEFRNDAGDVTTSIPSERQIQAYQRWQATHFGPAPHGMHTASAGGSGEVALPHATAPVREPSAPPVKAEPVKAAPAKRG